MKMKSKKGKNMLALLLAFAMIVTGIVVTPVNAKAAKKEKKAMYVKKRTYIVFFYLKISQKIPYLLVHIQCTE